MEANKGTRSFPTILNTANETLIAVASKLGVNLGNSSFEAGRHIGIIKNLEQAISDIYFASTHQKNKEIAAVFDPGTISELLDNSDDEDSDSIVDLIDAHILNASSRKSRKVNTGSVSVKPRIRTRKLKK